MTAPPVAGGHEEGGEDGDRLLRAWLLQVHAQTVVPPPPNPWRRRATLPYRAMRRLAVLVSEVGPQQAAVVSAEYARRRLTERA